MQNLHGLFQIRRHANYCSQWIWRKQGDRETCLLMRHYCTSGTFCSYNWNYFWKNASTICSAMKTKRVNVLCQYWQHCSATVCHKHMWHARHSSRLLTQYGFFVRLTTHSSFIRDNTSDAEELTPGTRNNVALRRHLVIKHENWKKGRKQLSLLSVFMKTFNSWARIRN
jgi:hypothetical protein